MAERSKAPVSGTGLFGGVGSNPTPISFGFFAFARPLFFGQRAEARKKKNGWHTHDGTRTHNLALRRGTPYPLGHAGG